MPLTLYVDGDRWRGHLSGVVGREPGLVPVVKGNGYGFGLGRLARRTTWLQRDTIAVGTYAEVAEVEKRFPGSVLVLSPWRPTVATPLSDRMVHTVGRLEDLRDLLARGAGEGVRPRVVLELLTSMLRHGFTAAGLREAGRSLTGCHLEGVALHLPLGREPAPGGGAADDRRGGGRPTHQHRLRVAPLRGRADPAPRRLAGLHVPAAGRHRSLARRPWRARRARDGDRRPSARTRPALRLPAAFGGAHRHAARRLRGHGARHRAGGAHRGQLFRSRAGSLARGGLDAAGLVRSPYTVDGKARFFAEPPHMQASMLFLPSGATVPEVGDEVPVRVRYTATAFDRVRIG